MSKPREFLVPFEWQIGGEPVTERGDQVAVSKESYDKAVAALKYYSVEDQFLDYGEGAFGEAVKNRLIGAGSVARETLKELGEI